MKRTLKRIDGKYYANGVEFDNFEDAFNSLWERN